MEYLEHFSPAINLGAARSARPVSRGARA